MASGNSRVSTAIFEGTGMETNPLHSGGEQTADGQTSQPSSALPSSSTSSTGFSSLEPSSPSPSPSTPRTAGQSSSSSPRSTKSKSKFKSKPKSKEFSWEEIVHFILYRKKNSPDSFRSHFLPLLVSLCLSYSDAVCLLQHIAGSGLSSASRPHCDLKGTKERYKRARLMLQTLGFLAGVSPDEILRILPRGTNASVTEVVDPEIQEPLYSSDQSTCHDFTGVALHNLENGEKDITQFPSSASIEDEDMIGSMDGLQELGEDLSATSNESDESFGLALNSSGDERNYAPNGLASDVSVAGTGGDKQGGSEVEAICPQVLSSPDLNKALKAALVDMFEYGGMHVLLAAVVGAVRKGEIISIFENSAEKSQKWVRFTKRKRDETWEETEPGPETETEFPDQLEPEQDSQRMQTQETRISQQTQQQWEELMEEAAQMDEQGEPGDAVRVSALTEGEEEFASGLALSSAEFDYESLDYDALPSSDKLRDRGTMAAEFVGQTAESSSRGVGIGDAGVGGSTCGGRNDDSSTRSLFNSRGDHSEGRQMRDGVPDLPSTSQRGNGSDSAPQRRARDAIADLILSSNVSDARRATPHGAARAGSGRNLAAAAEGSDGSSLAVEPSLSTMDDVAIHSPAGSALESEKARGSRQVRDLSQRPRRLLQQQGADDLRASLLSDAELPPRTSPFAPAFVSSSPAAASTSASTASSSSSTTNSSSSFPTPDSQSRGSLSTAFFPASSTRATPVDSATTSTAADPLPKPSPTPSTRQGRWKRVSRDPGSARTLFSPEFRAAERPSTTLMKLDLPQKRAVLWSFLRRDHRLPRRKRDREDIAYHAMLPPHGEDLSVRFRQLRQEFQRTHRDRLLEVLHAHFRLETTQLHAKIARCARLIVLADRWPGAGGRGGAGSNDGQRWLLRLGKVAAEARMIVRVLRLRADQGLAFAVATEPTWSSQGLRQLCNLHSSQHRLPDILILQHNKDANVIEYFSAQLPLTLSWLRNLVLRFFDGQLKPLHRIST